MNEVVREGSIKLMFQNKDNIKEILCNANPAKIMLIYKLFNQILKHHFKPDEVWRSQGSSGCYSGSSDMTDSLCPIQCCITPKTLLLSNVSRLRPCSRLDSAIVHLKLVSTFSSSLSLPYGLWNQVRETSAIGGRQPDALVPPSRLCELIGRRDLSLSLSSFPAPQPLSPSWHGPG